MNSILSGSSNHHHQHTNHPSLANHAAAMAAAQLNMNMNLNLNHLFHHLPGASFHPAMQVAHPFLPKYHHHHGFAGGVVGAGPAVGAALFNADMIGGHGGGGTALRPAGMGSMRASHNHEVNSMASNNHQEPDIDDDPKVELDQADLWTDFHGLGTEMGKYK